MISPRARLFFGTSCFCVVIALMLLWERSNPWRLSFHLGSPDQLVASRLTEAPSFIDIPSARIHLPVIMAQVNNGNWETTTQGVSYLLSSGQLGQIGNSVFYGHNWPNLLGNLTKVHPGQTILVTSADGKRYTYQVAFVTTVTPDQTHILAPSTDRRLTLYTCIGFFDTKRLVITAVQKES